MKKSVVRGLLLVSVLVSAISVTASAETVERSLDEWLAAQGTFCFPNGSGGCAQFFTPLPNMFGWTDIEQNRCAMVDYAGLADNWLQSISDGAVSLGTTFTGTVKEHFTPDGIAELTVRLVTSNALVFVVDGALCDIVSGPVVFGQRAQDVLAGATPSLADVTFVATWQVLTPGLPLKDLIQVFFFPDISEGLASIRLHADSHGELRAAFGVPDGTPGKLLIEEKGTFDKNNSKPFVKERIDLSVK